MTGLRSFLSCNQKDIHPFLDEDISWIESVLGLPNGFDDHQKTVIQDLESLDVEACPGSGKTTVLVAKLALLSRYWKPKSQGLCILSMTNAAREEIQERLGKTIEGQKLLHPPHFIGTIHGFASEFLAKPWLNSHQMWVSSIDEDLCRSERRKLLQEKHFLPLTDYLVSQQREKKQSEIDKGKTATVAYSKAKQWLEEHDAKSTEEKRLNIPSSWVIINEKYDVVSVNYGHKKELDMPDEFRELLSECIEQVARRGIYDFSDIFVFAKALLNSFQITYKIIRNRFPVLFIDEAQDTSKSQAIFLHDLFISSREDCGSTVTRQRFGDANQTIYNFEKPMLPDDVDPFPNKRFKKLTIPVSHRFDDSIARLSSPFETNPLSIPMKGMRVQNPREPKTGYKHCIIMFDASTRHLVIPAFAEYAAANLSEDELQNSILKVCSHVHNKTENSPATETDFARLIRDYYPSYVSGKLTKEYSQHKYFIDYLRHSQYLTNQSGELRNGLNKIAEGLLRAAIVKSQNSEFKDNQRSPFHKIKSLRNKHRGLNSVLQNEPKAHQAYIFLYKEVLIKKSILDQASWDTIAQKAMVIVDYLVACSHKEFETPLFFDYHSNDEESDNEVDKGVYESKKSDVYTHIFSDKKNGSIDIKLGTIHSVKGQTHTGTLILESTSRGPILGQLKTYILGTKKAETATVTEKERLNTLYVGLTRPSHLLCIALPFSHKKNASTTISWEKSELDLLKSKGWSISEVTPDGNLNFDI